jgi:DNA-binding MarR family transcriptional regulator
MPDPLRRRAAPKAAAAGKTIKDLLSYRIHRLANALSRGAALRYRQEFEVSLMEWRIIALLGDFAPMTLKELAKESGLDKSLASRAVASLVERGLVLREIGRQDAREVALRLSAGGSRLHQGLMRAALERDEAFAACMSEEERAVLDRVIGRLEREAKRQTARHSVGCAAE